MNDNDVKEIIGEYDTSNKEEVIEKFNNLVHTIENKDSILLNKLNDSPWHKVNEIESIEVDIYEATDEDVNIIITKEIEYTQTKHNNRFMTNIKKFI